MKEADAILEPHQMCLIHADFKHFLHFKAKDFHQYRNDSSIM